MKKNYLTSLSILLLCMATISAFAQKTVSGTVKDPGGNPIPSVSVLEKGTQNGTSTNPDGGFRLTVKNGAVLILQSVGFKTQEISSDRNLSNIILQEDQQALKEVVVTGLGVKQEKRSLGYSVSSIKTENLANDGSPLNSLSALYGQAPGLRLNATALGPSGGMNVNIRNTVALFSGSNIRPLFVIDGVPMLDGPTDINRSTGNGLNDLNMNDVESFEVLKGAKAALLYGSDGANGVILITTKTGSKKNGLGIEANYSRSVDNPWVMQKFQNEFGSGFPAAWNNPGVVDAQGFYLRNGQQAYYPTNYNFGPRLDGREILWYDNVKRPYVAQPDNIKALYQDGFTGNTNVSIQGGGPQGGFRVSYTNNDYKGIFKGYNLQDNKFLFNGNINITEKVKFKLTSTYVNSFSHNSPATNQDAFVTYGIPRQLDVARLEQEQVVDPETGYFWWYVQNRQAQNPTGGIVRDGLAKNYFWNQTQNTYNNTRDHYINSATLTINFTPNFYLETLGGFDLITNRGETGEKLTRPLSDGTGGYYGLSNSREVRYNGQSLLHFDKKIGKDFQLNTFVGGIIQRYTFDGMSRNTNGGFITRDWFSLNNSVNNQLNSSSSRNLTRLYAVVGSAQLAYKNWLYFDVQARNDWASQLPPENNSYFYPGASTSFIYTDAFKLPKWLSYGKFRVSLADVGRPGTAYFANTTYGIGNYGSVIYYTPPSDLPPLDLKNERKRELEFGLENRFLNNRLGFEFNVFFAKMYDQIMPLTVAPSTGVNSIRVNAGQINNTGFELNVYGTPIQTENFKWNVVFNASQSKPKIIKLAGGIKQQDVGGGSGALVTAREGEPYGQIVVSDYVRDAGGNLVVGSDGFYTTDATKPVVVGNVIPKAVGGLNNSLNYKGLSLDFNIDFSFGSKLISQTNMYMVGNGSAENTVAGRDERSGGLPYYINNGGAFVGLPSHSSTVPADSRYPFIMHNGVVLPGVKANGQPNDVIITAEDKYSYYWRSFMDIQPDVVYKNDYIKLRNVSIAYTLPTKWVSKMKLQRLTLSAFANNLAYLYKTMPNVDAEALNGTNVYFENNAWPAIRSYGMSIKAVF
jgi:TonB-linked SusC/RagA family outer membrane protein